MKKLLIILPILTALALAGCVPQGPNSNQPVNNSLETNANVAPEPIDDGNEINVFDFESCVQAGNPIMKSNPPQCQHNGVTYIQELPDAQITNCLPEQRNSEVCIKIYQPVCAKVNVQCIKAPCPPMVQTFGNSCEACANPLVESYVEGECPEKINVD